MRLRLIVVAAALSSASLSSSATSITPGSTVTPSSAGTFGGTQVATTGPVTLTPPSFTGTYTETVYADPNNVFCAGCLDFVVQVTNISPSNLTPAEIIARESTSSFSGYQVDTSYQAVAGGVAPVDTNWDDGGAGVLAFDFTSPVIAAGQTSDFLILQTNALTFTSGFLSLQDGTAMSGPAFEPTTTTAVTPEPSSLGLFGTGMLALAGVVRRRTLCFVS